MSEFEQAAETLRFQLRQARGSVYVPSEMERQVDFLRMAHAEVVAERDRLQSLIQMKVSIRDRVALESLRPEAIKAYLSARGWRCHTPLGGVAHYWCRGNGDEMPWILIPLEFDPPLADYQNRIDDIPKLLAQVEGRSELVIYYDIQQALVATEGAAGEGESE